MQTIEGDLLDIRQGTIVQQVNCRGVMGAGLAKQIRDKWPEVYDIYKEFLADCEEFSIDPLGETLVINVSPDRENDATLAVGLLFSQRDYGRDGCHTDYDALRSSLRGLSYLSVRTPAPLYIPIGLGCGLAGGDWSIVLPIIEEEQPEAILIRRP